MANHDPQKPNPMQPDPTPNAPVLIPVASLQFRVGFKMKMPGTSRFMGDCKATPPSTGVFTTIHYDPRLRHHVVAFFKTGTDLKRAPAEVLYVPEAMVAWRKA